MRKSVVVAGLAALTWGVWAGTAMAGPIANACLQTGRAGANAQVCTCIQQVADITLGGDDQRLAATFFRDPERAQKVHMSKSQSDDAFWQRYLVFGQQAEMACSG